MILPFIVKSIRLDWLKIGTRGYNLLLLATTFSCWGTPHPAGRPGIPGPIYIVLQFPVVFVNKL